MSAEKYILSSVNNTLKIIDCLGESGALPLVQITEKLGLGKSSVFRMLSTLEQAGYVEKTPKLEYRLSPKFIELGSKVLNRINPNKIIQEYLIQLRDQFNESTHHGVISANLNVLVVNKATSERAIRMTSEVGGTLPAYASGMGKAILAFSLDSELEQMIRQHEYFAYTNKTITDPDVLLQTLHTIKSQGYSMDDEEAEEGLTCYAAPILDNDGKAVSAISISGPTQRMEAQKHEIITAVKQAAQEIAQKIGYLANE